MAETITQLETGYIPDPDSKVRLLNLDDLDGRTRAVRRVREFETQLETDLGGDLTEAQKALSRRSAVLVAVLSDSEAAWAKDGTLDLGNYITATNSLRRLLVTLGVHRVSKRAGIAQLMDAE